MDDVKVWVFPLFGRHFAVIQGHFDAGSLHGHFPCPHLHGKGFLGIAVACTGFFQFLDPFLKGRLFLFRSLEFLYQILGPLLVDIMASAAFRHCETAWRP